MASADKKTKQRREIMRVKIVEDDVKLAVRKAAVMPFIKSRN
jgi:hypothetical protein